MYYASTSTGAVAAAVMMMTNGGALLCVLIVVDVSFVPLKRVSTRTKILYPHIHTYLHWVSGVGCYCVFYHFFAILNQISVYISNKSAATHS